jgi:hypothetical protein
MKVRKLELMLYGIPAGITAAYVLARAAGKVGYNPYLDSLINFAAGFLGEKIIRSIYRYFRRKDNDKLEGALSVGSVALLGTIKEIIDASPEIKSKLPTNLRRMFNQYNLSDPWDIFFITLGAAAGNLLDTYLEKKYNQK